ncbi:hypothetical protein [Pedobacter frigiditerrae]|uniref:hypothetical protein n=1 Tax=Pedobacter frigiditerrae TaxID=2530452 RepID=UPI0029301287|nr:hypothetical protein [Pedobacter frigiditerrae]
MENHKACSILFKIKGMIAVVTSCINPKTMSSITRSFFSLEERELQTIQTLKRLKAVGFKQIILADNSYDYDYSKLNDAIENVNIIHLKQYQFANKSINEVLILLSVLDYIPPDTKIFKISGRYFPTDNFKLELNETIDFKIKGFDFSSRRSVVSTRGYFVKDKTVYEEFLLSCLNEIYSYPYRIVGLRSLWIFIKEFFKPSLKTTSFISIEFAAARVLKKGHFKYELTDYLNIEGQIAGLQSKEFIQE